MIGTVAERGDFLRFNVAAHPFRPQFHGDVLQVAHQHTHGEFFLLLQAQRPAVRRLHGESVVTHVLGHVDQAGNYRLARERARVEHGKHAVRGGQVAVVHLDLQFFEATPRDALGDNVDLAEAEEGVPFHLVDTPACNGVVGVVLQQEPPAERHGDRR